MRSSASWLRVAHRPSRAGSSAESPSNLEKLGQWYTAKGDYAAAEPFLRQALATQEKALAPDDPNLAQCLESYAALLRKTSREDEATATEARAQRIRTARSGR